MRMIVLGWARLLLGIGWCINLYVAVTAMSVTHVCLDVAMNKLVATYDYKQGETATCVQAHHESSRCKL